MPLLFPCPLLPAKRSVPANIPETDNSIYNALFLWKASLPCHGSFDEFWEKYFEINGLYEESDIWFSHLMTYCCLARESTSTESMEGDGCLEREAHMAAKYRIPQFKSARLGLAAQFSKALCHLPCTVHGMKGEKEGQWEENLMAWMEPYRILVITGGFHTPGIRERLSGSGWASANGQRLPTPLPIICFFKIIIGMAEEIKRRMH